MSAFIRRLLFSGGVINYIIISEYIIVLAIVAERLIYYVATRYSRKRLSIAVAAVTDFASLRNFAEKNTDVRSVPMRVIGEFLRCEKTPPCVLNETMQRFVESAAAEMEARLDLLSLFANVAPLCGLLGTVVGLMSAFDRIQQLGNAVDVGQLAGGIWVAMITTATGLIVAIPALAVCRLFELEMNRRMKDTVEIISHLKEKLRPDSL